MMDILERIIEDAMIPLGRIIRIKKGYALELPKEVLDFLGVGVEDWVSVEFDVDKHQLKIKRYEKLSKKASQPKDN